MKQRLIMVIFFEFVAVLIIQQIMVNEAYLKYPFLYLIAVSSCIVIMIISSFIIYHDWYELIILRNNTNHEENGD